MADPKVGKSHTAGRAIVTTLPSGERYLLVIIDVDCPSCGKIQMQLPGHHLRVFRDIIVEFMDLHPDLVHKDDEIEVLTRLRFQGNAPGDPSRN